MNSLNLSRLRNVAIALRDAAKDKLLAQQFDMDRYGHAVDIFSKDTCGTPSCALGHYAARNDVQSFLKLNVNGDLVYARKSKGRILGADFSDRRVRRYFGLTPTETANIFDTGGCNNAASPGWAALFIERFCNKKEKELGIN